MFLTRKAPPLEPINKNSEHLIGLTIFYISLSETYGERERLKR